MTDLSFLTDRTRLFLIAGPCVIEGRDFLMRHAETLKEITSSLGIPFIFKSSYRKANRNALSSFTGLGIERGLAILAEVKREFDVPILSDVHEVAEISMASEVCDVLQIPAFLSRQTDLLVTAGLSQKVVNIKKAQWMSGSDMVHAAAKVRSAGNANILLTERGTSFGYHNNVVDFRNLVLMKETGYPVVYDATHSVQLPSANGSTSGGDRRFIAPLAHAAVAIGVSGIFCEVHENPPAALSDSATQWPVSELKGLLESLLRIREAL